MDFRKKSHVYNNNNKFLYIINENKMILINTNLSDETQIKKRFETLSFTIISFDHFQTFLLSRAKRLLSNLRIPLKNECRRICNRNTSLFKKNSRERERKNPPPPRFSRLPDSLYSTRSIGLVIFIRRQYSRRCTGISSFVPVIKLEISRFAGQRLCDSSQPLPPNPFVPRGRGKKKTWKGTCKESKSAQRWGDHNRFGGYSPISPLNVSLSL